MTSLSILEATDIMCDMVVKERVCVRSYMSVFLTSLTKVHIGLFSMHESTIQCDPKKKLLFILYDTIRLIIG